MDSSETGNFSRHERFAFGVFAVLLLVHFWGVATGWTSRSLPGNEFRQAQTAISALFIQREHNFSLAYPTPVLGAPWSVPFEFPLYQWTVVALSNGTGLPLIQAGRTVSIVCFYLSLPALWLLLGRVGVSRFGRWIILGLTLTCPLYIFYTRAVLIETMALMFSLWFLAAFVRAVERWNLRWLAIANVAGMLAGAVKVTTLLVVLFPAGAWAAFLLGTAYRVSGPDRTGELARVLGRILAAVTLPFAATYGWLHYADAVKARNPLAIEFMSENLRGFNFGTWMDRTAWHLWAARFHLVRTEVLGSLAMVVVLAAFLIWGRARWKWIAASLLVFFSIQLVLPILYEVHAYYFVANGFFLLMAVGLVVTALFESKAPRGVAWAVLIAVHAAQMHLYVGQHFEEQRYWSPGTTGLTDALKRITEPEDVLVVVGEDWSSVTPFFAERRAVMLRLGWERNLERLDRALANLRGKPVSALVLHGPVNADVAMRSMILNRLDFSPVPVFTWREATVYLSKGLRAPALAVLAAHPPEEIKINSSDSAAAVTLNNGREIEVAKLSPLEKRAFAEMSPEPVRVFTTFGIGGAGEPGAFFFNAHPDSRLWFRPPPGERKIEASFRIVDEAWKDVPVGDATDGVSFRITEIRRDGVKRTIFERLLSPRTKPEDRGVQQLNVTMDLVPEAELLFETTPGPAGQYSRDWAGWGKIEIR